MLAVVLSKHVNQQNSLEDAVSCYVCLLVRVCAFHLISLQVAQPDNNIANNNKPGALVVMRSVENFLQTSSQSYPVGFLYALLDLWQLAPATGVPMVTHCGSAKNTTGFVWFVVHTTQQNFVSSLDLCILCRVLVMM